MAVYMARRRRRSNTGIPGLSFSWRRALGVSRVKHKFARKTGIPTTRSGRNQKIGRLVTGGGCLMQLIGILFIVLLMAVFAF
jgi:hypothetical protein